MLSKTVKSSDPILCPLPTHRTLNLIHIIPYKPHPTPGSPLGGGLDLEVEADGFWDTSSATWEQWLGPLSPLPGIPALTPHSPTTTMGPPQAHSPQSVTC